MTIILLLELAYTVLGGMVSVVITDFIQLRVFYRVSHYSRFPYMPCTYAGWGNVVE